MSHFVRCAALCATLVLGACGSRSGLNDLPYEPTSLFCSTETRRARPGVPLRILAGVPRGAVVRWEIASTPPGATATITPDGQGQALFVTETEGAFQVRLVVDGLGDGGAPAACLFPVTVRANGPAAICPPDIETRPLQEVTVTGRAQGDRPIASVAWSLESAPPASARPAPAPTDQPATRFTPDVAGDFRLRLTATDTNGNRDHCVTTVRAVSRDGLRVEMFWDPPGRTCPREDGAACDSSDLDLHLLREAGSSRPWGTDDDCFFMNCQVARGLMLSWGNPGLDDDPRLDIDDVTGHGPENINLTAPSARTYRVGVHYFANHGAGRQAANVLIYCGGSTPVARFGPTVLSAPGAQNDNDFWVVADVSPRPDGTCSVAPLSAPGGGARILTYADARRGL